MDKKFHKKRKSDLNFAKNVVYNTNFFYWMEVFRAKLANDSTSAGQLKS